MNCKGNQLVILKTKPGDYGHEHYGKIFFITSLYNSFSWKYEGTITNPEGKEYVALCDSVLQPIDNPDEDAVDETLTWKCGKPPKIKTKQKEPVNV